jgi:hypothetical protein
VSTSSGFLGVRSPSLSDVTVDWKAGTGSWTFEPSSIDGTSLGRFGRWGGVEAVGDTATGDPAGGVSFWLRGGDKVAGEMLALLPLLPLLLSGHCGIWMGREMGGPPLRGMPASARSRAALTEPFGVLGRSCELMVMSWRLVLHMVGGSRGLWYKCGCTVWLDEDWSLNSIDRDVAGRVDFKERLFSASSSSLFFGF